MVDIVIVGTVGLDDVTTPFGSVREALGGSAVFAAYSASFFAAPGMVAVIGHDFPEQHLQLLSRKSIHLDGIKKEGKNFRWKGKYEFDMNEAKTIDTQLNCLASFDPVLPDSYRKAKYVFLGNLDPSIQRSVLEQIEDPVLVVMDTMNFWISHKKDELLEMIQKCDVFLLNDGEARQLFGTVNLAHAARKALALGPTAVIIKKGEHGALLFTKEKHFSAGGYPLEAIKDPTGCGDCFGGGFIGYLAKTGDTSEKNLRKAVVYGSAIASFNAEDFSLDRLTSLSLPDIEHRVSELREMREF
ncbi:sugar kinase [Candidatus Woesearchaeota archaeon]|nr:sugar kinase [Candidatus Woesearchaeota archaeon]